MGQYFSSYNTNPVNYDCPVCQSSGKLPNSGGRFFIINETQCKCNGCNSVFDKSRFFKTADNTNTNTPPPVIDGN
jgi:hypothetical protein